MIDIPQMDQKDLAEFLSSGSPTDAEFFKANISEGFDNSTLGVAWDKTKELFSDPVIGQAPSPTDIAKENMSAQFENRAPRDLKKEFETKSQVEKLSEEDWKKSEFYREGISYQSGLSKSRAKYLAENFDERKERELILSAGDTGLKRKTMAFAGQMVGSIPDPINLIPFGAGFKGASIASKVGAGIVEGAISNVAVSAITRPYWQDRGIDSTWQDYVNDLAVGGVLGGGFSLVGSAFSRARTRRAETSVKAKSTVAAALDESINALQKGETPNLKNIPELDIAVKEIWDAPEIQASKSFERLQAKLVEDFKVDPQVARDSLTPMAAHARAFAADFGMTVDDFMGKYGINDFQKELPSKLKKAKSIGDIIEIKGTADEAMLTKKLEDELSSMAYEIDQAEINTGLIFENGDTTGKVINRTYDNTYPEWYREVGAKNKEDFKKILESKSGARYERLVKIAEDRLLNGYETRTSGPVLPDNSFRQSKGMDIVTAPGADVKGKVIRFSGGEGLVELPNGEQVYFDKSVMKRDAKVGDEVTVSLGDNPEMLEASTLFQNKGAEKGAVTFQEDGKAIVSLFENADRSTIIHETGHIFLRNLEEFSKLEGASPALKADFDRLTKWLGVKEGEAIKRVHHEKFARGFEKYLAEGKSPVKELNGVFSRFREWFIQTFKTTEGLKVKLNDDAREIYGKLLGGERAFDFDPPKAPEAPAPIYKTEAELDTAIDEIEARVSKSEAITDFDREELDVLKINLENIDKETQAIDSIVDDLETLFQSEAAPKESLDSIIKKSGLSKSELNNLAKELKTEIKRQASILNIDETSELAKIKAVEEYKKALAIEAKEQKRQAYLSLLAKESVTSKANKLISNGATPQQAILSQIEGDSGLRGIEGGGDSVYGNYQSLSNANLNKMHMKLQEISPKIEKLFEDDIEFNENVILEMMQIREDGKGQIGISGDELAVKAAKILSESAEELRQRVNMSGARIGKLDGWVPRVHDMDKIILKGEESWIRFMKENLDLKRSFPDAETDVAINKALSETYQNIVTGVRKERGQVDPGEALFKTPRNIAKKMGESRVLHFADPRKEVDYLREFGQGNNILQTMSHHTDMMSRKISLMEKFGPNPDSVLSSSIEKLRQDIRDKKIFGDLTDEKRVKLLEDLGDKNKVVNREGAIGKSLMFALGEATSFEYPRLKNAAAIIRAWNSVTKLGSATLAQFPDFLNLANEHRIVRGNNFASAWVETFKNYFEKMTPEKKRVLDRLGVMADTMNFQNFNRFDADNINNKIGRLNDTLFKISGQDWHTKSAKSGFALSMMRDLGELVDLDFDSLPAGYREALSQYGSIDPKSWDLIRQIGVEEVEGQKYLIPDLIQKLDDAEFEDIIPNEFKETSRPQRQDSFPGVDENPGIVGEALAMKEKKFENKLKDWEDMRDFHLKRAKFKLETQLRTFFIEETRNAVLEPDLKVRRQVTLGTKTGTATGEAVRLMTQFKSFAYAYYDRALRGKRFSNDGTLQDYGGVIHQALASVFLGYVAMTAKDLSKGLEPKDPTLGQTWLQATFQSGGLGIMGDFLQSGLSARSGTDAVSTILGPTISQAGTLSKNVGKAVGEIYKESKGEEGDFFGVTSDFVDFGKSQIPFNTLWYTRAAFDFMFWHQLKETLEPGSIRRSERRLRKEFNQEYIMSPNEVFDF